MMKLAIVRRDLRHRLLRQSIEDMKRLSLIYSSSCPNYGPVKRMLEEIGLVFEEIKQDSDELFKDDLYYEWYNNDRNVMNSVGMERFSDHVDCLGHPWAGLDELMAEQQRHAPGADGRD